MSSDFSIEWVAGPNTLIQGLEEYQRKVMYAIEQVALYWGPVMETAAKQDAPWTDRTANARQSLHYEVVPDLSRDIVELYLAHGMEYGLWLEVRWAGKYQILWPTISEHLTPIKQMLDGIFR